MYYQNVKYNIPVALWLPERYPMQPPLMYVVPTPDMVIKPRHTFVDPSGLVASPYLANWAYPDSNLRELAQVRCAVCAGVRWGAAPCFESLALTACLGAQERVAQAPRQASMSWGAV